jgi:spermidine synthase
MPTSGLAPSSTWNNYFKTLLFALFFVSGFCGLLYQIIWVRIAFASFGVILPIMSVVISVFMLGLSLGSWAGGKLIPILTKRTKSSAIIFYGLAELIIGASAFAVPQLFKMGEGFLLPFGGMESVGYLLASASILAIAIFPWCFAMGVTYPFMMAFVVELKCDDKNSFSFLYLANVIGATLGTILTALVLVEILGFRNSLMIAATGNFGIGLVSLIIGRNRHPVMEEIYPSSSSKEIISSDKTSQKINFLIYLILFTTGFTSLAMEVSWVRAFTPVLGTKIYAFAMSLATYLFATTLGSHWYRRNAGNEKVISTPTLLGLCFIFAFLPVLLSDPRIPPTWGMVLASIFPFSAVLGYLTPKLIDEFSLGNPNKAGRAYALNIFGGILGPLVAAYLLMPASGVKWTLILLAAPYGILLLFCTDSYKRSIPIKWTMGLVGSAAGLVAIVYTTTFENPQLYGQDTWHSRDHTATVISHGQGRDKVLLVNGISLTSLTPLTKMMAHLPLSIREKKPQSALAIALGMGASMRSLASWGIDVKCVELIPSVVKALPFYFEDAESIVNQPNVELIVDDGRRYLKRSGRKFDVITIDPPPPIESAGTSLLYSIEFNQIIADHLNKGGVFHQWFPFGEAKIFQAMIRSIVEVFPYVKTYRSLEGWGIHILASMEPFETPTAEIMVARLPLKAKKDLLEWADGVDIHKYLNLTLKNEIPLGQLLNHGDLTMYISDDRPFNEYFLLRRWRDHDLGFMDIFSLLFFKNPRPPTLKSN